MTRINIPMIQAASRAVCAASLVAIAVLIAGAASAQIPVSPIPKPPEYVCTGCAGVATGTTNLLYDYVWPSTATKPRNLTYQGLNWHAVIGMAQAPFSKRVYTLHGTNEVNPCTSCGAVYGSRVNQLTLQTGQSYLGPQLTSGSNIVGFVEGDIAFNPNDTTETLYGVNENGVLFSVNPLGGGQVTSLGTIAGASYFRKIVAMAFAPNGSLYVLDSGANQLINATNPSAPIAVSLSGIHLNANRASMGFVQGTAGKLLYVISSGILAIVDLSGKATIKAYNVNLDRGFIGTFAQGGWTKAPKPSLPW